MTRFKWMAKEGIRGAEMGIVRPDILAKYFRYEMYLNRLAEGKTKAEAISITAEMCRCEQSTIYRAIQYFCK